jgi:hypothetical protein
VPERGGPDVDDVVSLDLFEESHETLPYRRDSR